MGTPLELLQDVQKFNVKSEVLLSFRRNRRNYGILQATQMLEGKNSKGLQIGHYRPPTGAYAEMKYGKNSLAGKGNVDLKLHDNFYKGIVATLMGDDISVKSTDSKYKKLTDAYGQEIWGLDDPMMEFFAEMMDYQFKRRFLEVTGLEFSGLEDPGLPANSSTIKSLIAQQ